MRRKIENLLSIVVIAALIGIAAGVPIAVVSNLKKAEAAPLEVGATHRILFNSEVVTTTAKSASADVLGTTTRDIYWKSTGLTTGTLWITATGMWLDQSMSTSGNEVTVGTSETSGVITNVFETDLYPVIMVTLDSTTTMTTTVGLVAQ